MMAYASLRDFIARLEGAGRLVRVSAPVSPVLEITEILMEGVPRHLDVAAVTPDGRGGWLIDVFEAAF